MTYAKHWRECTRHLFGRYQFHYQDISHKVQVLYSYMYIHGVVSSTVKTPAMVFQKYRTENTALFGTILRDLSLRTVEVF